MVAAPKDFEIVGGRIAATVTLAEAVRPVPPSTEVTAPETLFLTPRLVPVTFTPNMHEALPARVAPDRLTALDPAVAVIVPAPQLPVCPLGVATTSPAGRLSMTPTPVKPLPTLGLVIVKVSEVDPFNGMLAAPKFFAIVGGRVPAPQTSPLRPIRLPDCSVNHKLPSGPVVMQIGRAH